MQEDHTLAFEVSNFQGKFWVSQHVKEMFTAIWHSNEKRKPFLVGRHFKMKTDHNSLKYFFEHLSSPKPQKWMIKMLGYDFEIEYKKKKEPCSRCSFLKL